MHLKIATHYNFLRSHFFLTHPVVRLLYRIVLTSARDTRNCHTWARLYLTARRSGHPRQQLMSAPRWTQSATTARSPDLQAARRLSCSGDSEARGDSAGGPVSCTAPEAKEASCISTEAAAASCAVPMLVWTGDWRLYTLYTATLGWPAANLDTGSRVTQGGRVSSQCRHLLRLGHLHNITRIV